MKKGILFVDDEEKLLSGLKRNLRSMREAWEMQFASSGREALSILEQSSIDVVVSDMRMPDIDGETLLAEIKNKYPSIIRIMLTGTTEKASVFKSLKVAHQYLSKPCDAEKIKSTIYCACMTKNMLESDILRNVLSRMETLPSIPALYMQLVEELEKEDSSIQKLGKIISNDVGMTAKILQVVNSPYFGLYQHISNPEQAVSLLGLDTVKALVLSVKIFAKYNHVKMPGFSPEDLYSHSLLTASLAKAIAKEEKQPEVAVNDAFTAGVLHDLGKLVLAANFREDYQRAVSLAGEKKVHLWEAEKEIFNATHSEVGAYLLGIWGLPNPIIEAIAFHHCPTNYPNRAFAPITAVHVANVLEHSSHVKEGGNGFYQVDQGYINEMDMPEKPELWKKVSEKILEKGDESNG